MAVAEACPICTSSEDAKQRFAAAKVAEHVKRHAKPHEGHREWIDEHTDDGTIAESREVLSD